MGKYLSCIAIQITMNVILVLVAFLMIWVVLYKLFSILTKRYLWKRNQFHIILDTYVSRIIDLLLPLMSYLAYRDEKDYPDGGQNQIIIVWTVLLEIIRTSLLLKWELWESTEQFTRLLWVMYLVYGQRSLQGLRRDLFVLCIIGLVFECFKAITLWNAKRYTHVDKKPKLIATYMKEIIEEGDPQASPNKTPLESCKYIVFGEETLNSASAPNKHLNNQNHSIPDKLLMVGKLFQRKTEIDRSFRYKSECLPEIGLSFALAKLLRRRFSDLPLAEANSKNALEFVLNDLLCSWPSTENLTPKEKFEVNAKRVFRIIWTELSFLTDMVRIEVYAFYDFKGIFVQWLFTIAVISTFPYIIWAAVERRSKWVSSMVDRYQNCSRYNAAQFPRKAAELNVAIFDTFTTLALIFLCFSYLIWWLWKYYRSNWGTLHIIKDYFLLGRPTWVSKIYMLFFNVQKIYERPFRCQDTVEYLCLSGNPSWVHVDVQKALLISLQNCNGKLTSGQSSLTRHKVLEHFNWALQQPNNSNTATILVWHIATSLLDEDNDSSEHLANRKVAMTLSNYCKFLVTSFPELLPDKVYLTEEVYQAMDEDISSAKPLQKPSIVDIVVPKRMRQTSRKQSAKLELHSIRNVHWKPDSVVGKGVRLFNEFKDKEKVANDKVKWKVLADFWAEMLLYIAPSDNVKGHAKIIGRRELITQVWALLTHAGITSRPEIEECHDLGDNNV